MVRACLALVVLLGALFMPLRPARAEKQDARKHYDQATAAFGLGRYADAAAEYEAAFRLRPDPALLYNCAQSYRLSGNKPRALELYHNYVRLYGDAPNADDARKHVIDLELQIAAEAAGATRAPAPVQPVPQGPLPAAAPPPNPRPPAPVALATAGSSTFGPTSSASPSSTMILPPPLPPPAVPPPAEASVDLASAPPPLNPVAGSEGQATVLHQPWFWVAVGAVVVGGTVAILLATRSEKDPATTLGTISGN